MTDPFPDWEDGEVNLFGSLERSIQGDDCPFVQQIPSPLSAPPPQNLQTNQMQPQKDVESVILEDIERDLKAIDRQSAPPPQDLQNLQTNQMQPQKDVESVILEDIERDLKEIDRQSVAMGIKTLPHSLDLDAGRSQNAQAIAPPLHVPQAEAEQQRSATAGGFCSQYSQDQSNTPMSRNVNVNVNVNVNLHVNPNMQPPSMRPPHEIHFLQPQPQAQHLPQPIMPPQPSFPLSRSSSFASSIIAQHQPALHSQAHLLQVHSSWQGSQSQLSQCSQQSGLSFPRIISTTHINAHVDVDLALAELNAAVHLLDPSVTAALLEARTHHAELVAKDSPPIRFLELEKFNPWAAARRLALYWTLRKDLFRDRAFLPMDMTGEGALSQEDVAYLSTGFCQLLPFDKFGRTVCFVESYRRPNNNIEFRARLHFYVSQVGTENPMSQKDGAVVLFVPDANMMTGTNAWNSIVARSKTAFPSKFAAFHVVIRPKDRGSFILDTVTSLFRKVFRIEGFYLHTPRTMEELTNTLVEHGFIKNHLPQSLGGEWTDEHFARWKDLRVRSEWELPPRGESEAWMPHIRPVKTKPASMLTTEEKKDRRRRLNVVNCRSKRSRRRVGMVTVRNEVDDLERRNQAVRADNERLEKLLEAAAACVQAQQKKTTKSFDSEKPWDR